MTPTVTAHVINVAGQTERMRHMQNSLAALGLPCERIAAVGLDDAAAFSGLPPDRIHLSPGELACHCSHVRTWQVIAAGTDAWGLVLEDDVIFSADARAGIDAALSVGTADLLRIEDGGLKKAVLSRKGIGAGETGFRLFDYTDGVVGSAAYLLSRDAAQRLVAQPSAYDRPLDRVLFNPALRDLSVQMLWPAVAIQSDCIARQRGRLGPQWTQADLPVFGSTLDHHEARHPKSLAKKIAAEWAHVSRATRFALTGRHRRTVPLSAAGPLRLSDAATP